MPSSRADSMSPERETSTLPFIYDTIIIGAGPCGLATAARLREHTPSAIFTDEEHHRYHWIRKHAGQATIKNSKTGKVRPLGSDRVKNEPSLRESNSHPSMLVLDNSGDTWMAKWERLFKLLEISHLRSPMFFHPDPRDRDGLLAYAHAAGREDECIEIAGCVGKELSKHQMKKRRNNRKPGEQARASITIDERDRKDYFTPPADLFTSYCTSIATRYDLLSSDLIQKATASNIQYDYVKHISPNEKIFTIATAEGQTYYTRTAVLAVGAGNTPTVPAPFPQRSNGAFPPNTCHAFHPNGDAVLQSRLHRLRRSSEETNILVVGGGLTSVQIIDRVLRHHHRTSPNLRVFHLTRSCLKIKPFDVDLSWIGKFRNHEKASFWSADTDCERSEMVKVARGGGSVTPRFAKVLKNWVEKGKVEVHEGCKVARSEFHEEGEGGGEGWWEIETEPKVENLEKRKVHFVYFATGVQSDFEKLGMLRNIREEFPVEGYDGLPALTDDLMWKEGVPLFVTGKFAALRLGPGAGNLEGARLGAERIAWGMQDFLSGSEEGCGNGGGFGTGGQSCASEYRFAAGIGSRFESLEVEG
ncbi:hypothetical protein CKM354_000726600 [Cercospora kikuchii]|uniref:L-ornithine N(5)-monooxygenase [NAD(P)H] n=1 Tax=Cercospora kikuchii TaxID=84275 RepID=A0A9P3FHB6_9PEZI|nr:uncharacterized protein CKM354_000726600 [Cercospora kikuchii]GIZ44057.1 hypothetical protein CKM354_000726600 [Cercospora kikuchii]